MKKIILGLFLILGAISFAAPKYINTSKLENTGYEITADDEDIFSIGKVTDVEAISILFYPMPDKTSKEVSDAVKSSAPDEVKFISSSENKRAYIIKFKAKDGSYTYSFVGKKPKVKNCYISTLYITNKDFKDNELDKVADQTLNEIESYLK